MTVIHLDQTSADSVKKLLGLAEEKDPGMVVRKALSLYEHVLRETGRGASLILRYPPPEDEYGEGEEKEIVL